MNPYRPGDLVFCTHMPWHYNQKLPINNIYTVIEYRGREDCEDDWIQIGKNQYETKYFIPVPEGGLTRLEEEVYGLKN